MNRFDFIYNWHYLWMGFGFLLSAFLAMRVLDFNMVLSEIIAEYYEKKSAFVKTIFAVNALTLVANSTIWGFLLLGWGVAFAFILDLIFESVLMAFLVYKTPKLFELIKESLFSVDKSEP